jgi:hypothetical protein
MIFQAKNKKIYRINFEEGSRNCPEKVICWTNFNEDSKICPATA